VGRASAVASRRNSCRSAPNLRDIAPTPWAPPPTTSAHRRGHRLIKAQLGGPLPGANRTTFARSEPYRFWTRNGHEANAAPDRWRALERVRSGTEPEPLSTRHVGFPTFARRLSNEVLGSVLMCPGSPRFGALSDRLGSEIRCRSSPAGACNQAPVRVRHCGHQLDRSRGKGPL
jgi:hypothetical protein